MAIDLTTRFSATACAYDLRKQRQSVPIIENYHSRRGEFVAFDFGDEVLQR